MIKYEKTFRYLKPLTSDQLLNLKEIDWFEKCGKEIEFNSKLNLKKVASKEIFITSCNSIDWENYQLDKRNELTIFLDKTRQNESSEWNNLTKGVREFLEKEVFETIENKLLENNIPNSVFDSVKWDILSYCQELAYKKYNIPLFYTHLFEIYKNGHFPCGNQNETILVY